MMMLRILVMVVCAWGLPDIRGGADKVTKLDPRSPPLAARAIKPLRALVTRYDAAVEANPSLELWVQIGGTLLAIQLFNTAVGDRRYSVLVARAMYVAFLAIHQAVLAAVKNSVEDSDDLTPLSLPANPLLASMANLGAKDGEGTNALLAPLLARDTTFRDYDLDMIRKGRTSQLGSILAMAYLHLRRGYLQPLVIQTVMGLFALLREPLVQIHLLKRPAEGVLKRPFEPPVPAWLKALQDQMQKDSPTAEDAADEQPAVSSEQAQDDDDDDEDDDDDDEPGDDDTDED
ncbi:hypothetical protein CTAYLR_002237 [Chrysophaeum taylorii]|uniref:Uncharacterized protein n=1 Tax=Chrysophaeum taylorii TaxID=2483200 RepID=A0AAD7XRJ9_9STRA|nr:hypothetical protein CTAYLR_002237 [Chrysophaeum taylorii]